MGCHVNDRSNDVLEKNLYRVLTVGRILLDLSVQRTCLPASFQNKDFYEC